MEIDQSLDLATDTLFDKILLFIASVLFLMTIVFVTLQVVIRTFNLPLSAPWTEPLARFALIIGTYFGAAVASRNNEHIKMDIVLRKVGELYPKIKYGFDVLVFIFVNATLLVAIYGLSIGAFNDWGTNYPDVRGITLGMMYLSIGLGLAFMFLYEFYKVKETLPLERWYRSITRSSTSGETK